MDKVFKAIGRFFKKIWDWIKTTAWIQPLLIVAIIFGIIFSINPIVNAIQDAVNADDTGEFYDAHDVCFRDLFDTKGMANQDPSYKSKNYLSDTSGDVLVIYVNDTTLEDDVATLYNSEKFQGGKLYIVDFSTEENQRSKWDTTGDWTAVYAYYQYNSADEYYDYLLDSLVEAYDNNDEDSWRNSYAKEFYAQYGYSAFYSGFKSNDDTYTTSSTSASDASSDLHLPAAVKYHNGEIVDMRFASNGGFTDYGTSTKTLTNYQVLSDLWTGIK